MVFAVVEKESGGLNPGVVLKSFPSHAWLRLLQGRWTEGKEVLAPSEGLVQGSGKFGGAGGPGGRTHLDSKERESAMLIQQSKPYLA